MEYFGQGSPSEVIDADQTGRLLDELLEQLGSLRRVLLLPPDYTRYHSNAGQLTVMLYERLKERSHVEILPAIGTHFPMTTGEIDKMFPGIPEERFRVHDWRKGVVRLGEVPSRFVREVSEGRLESSIACEIDRLLMEGDWDRIISIGQLVPHEVAGIANYNKNVLIGAGGRDTIGKTHFLGAVYGLERIMGREQSPVRDVLNYMSEHFLRELPLIYLMNVRGRDDSGRLVTRGLFVGDDDAAYHRGARLSGQVNLDLLDRPLQKVVVSLDPQEYKSTWLGNKAVYRTRMAIADGGELIVLAPGVEQFGEDRQIDRLIRKHGYRGTPEVLNEVEVDEDLKANLSAAAHLIHGSSEGRFTITYCPGKMTREEIESVGYQYADLDSMIARYRPEQLSEGSNDLPGGEAVFFISNPALGLWALRSRFEL